jgi:hypothetical protein
MRTILGHFNPPPILTICISNIDLKCYIQKVITKDLYVYLVSPLLTTNLTHRSHLCFTIH